MCPIEETDQSSGDSEPSRHLSQSRRDASALQNGTKQNGGEKSRTPSARTTSPRRIGPAGEIRTPRNRRRSSSSSRNEYIQRHEKKEQVQRRAYEVDGSLDVLGDGGGALVLAGLVPVEPPHVVRLQGARVAPLVHQPPQPRVRRRRRRLPAASHSHGAIHLHHPRPDTSPRTARQWKQGTGDRGGGVLLPLLPFSSVWFGLFMPRREGGEGGKDDDDPWMAVRPQAQVWWWLCYWALAGKGLQELRVTDMPSGIITFAFVQGWL